MRSFMDKTNRTPAKHQPELKASERKKVFICSQYRGKEANIIQMNLLCYKAYTEHNVLPISPHAFFAQFLDENNDKQKKDIVGFGLELISWVDEFWVCGVSLSNTMQIELRKAKKLNKPIRYFDTNLKPTCPI